MRTIHLLKTPDILCANDSRRSGNYYWMIRRRLKESDRVRRGSGLCTRGLSKCPATMKTVRRCRPKLKMMFLPSANSTQSTELITRSRRKFRSEYTDPETLPIGRSKMPPSSGSTPLQEHVAEGDSHETLLKYFVCLVHARWSIQLNSDRSMCATTRRIISTRRQLHAHLQNPLRPQNP